MNGEISVKNIIIDLNTRVRVLEERYNLLREKLLVVNQNMIGEYKKTISEIKAINTDLKEIREDVNQLKDTFKDIIKEMENFARKDNLKVLEKYINMWNPLNFVTEKDVERLIDNRLGKQKKQVKRKKRIKK
jgi:archaellum component FlaC